MPEIDCKVCEDLREDVPQFIQNGITNSMCTSLQNDTGLRASLGHNDCEDLNAINDCTIGKLGEELEAAAECDWKEVMHNLLENLYQMLKAIICAICGIWEHIHDILSQIAKILKRLKDLEDIVDGIDTQADRIDCIVNYLTQGAPDIKFVEATSGDAYVVAGKGVSFLQPDGGTGSVNIYLQYVAGGFVRGGGSVDIYGADYNSSTDTWTPRNWTDPAPCLSFDV